MAIRMTLTDVGYPITDLQAISAWVQESETPGCGRGTCPCQWTAASSIPTMRRRSSPMRCGNGCKHSGWHNGQVDSTTLGERHAILRGAYPSRPLGQLGGHPYLGQDRGETRPGRPFPLHVLRGRTKGARSHREAPQEPALPTGLAASRHTSPFLPGGLDLSLPIWIGFLGRL
jgi:hypothetical protein